MSMIALKLNEYINSEDVKYLSSNTVTMQDNTVIEIDEGTHFRILSHTNPDPLPVRTLYKLYTYQNKCVLKPSKDGNTFDEAMSIAKATGYSIYLEDTFEDDLLLLEVVAMKKTTNAYAQSILAIEALANRGIVELTKVALNGDLYDPVLYQKALKVARETVTGLAIPLRALSGETINTLDNIDPLSNEFVARFGLPVVDTLDALYWLIDQGDEDAFALLVEEYQDERV